MAYAVSTIYGEGQKFYESINQGSVYMEVSYTNPLKFDPNFTITTPRDEAYVEPTISNYAAPAHDYFMGNFTGFWVHKIYRDGHLVYTTQGVNQDLFIPIQYDSIQSVSLNVSESIPYDGPVRPPVPAPGVGVMLGLAALCIWGRKRFK
ncbi:MAG: hypothetical protein RL491_598 [Bacteroidota bacterium]|jgi:hypothetical protein